MNDFVGNICEVKQNMEIVLKSEIGLFADHGIRLSLSGIKYRIKIVQSVN